MPNAETNDLSERELDILKLVATGASNKEIAQKLFISSNTVKVHLRNIFTKIGVTSRTEAAMFAVRSGLTETLSPQMITQSNDIEFQANRTAALPQVHSLADIFRNKLYLRYFGLFVLVLLLIISSILYIRNNNIRAVTAILPTSTPRVQWFELAGLPTPRQGLAVANYENEIYAIGGETTNGISNIVESYDPQTNTWIVHSTKPTAVTDIHAAVIGGLIYVPGGRLASGRPTSITEIYDPRSDKWTTGSALPNPLSAYALTVFEGRIYIFGGWNGSQEVNNAYEYDPRNELWSELPAMPTARSFAGAVTVGGKMYVIGGWNGSQALTVNEVYLPDLIGGGSRWVQASPLPSGRYGMGIANLADIIFLIGGKGPDNNLAVIALSTEQPNWGQIEAPFQSGWSFLGTLTVGTRLYLLGGSNSEGVSNKMWYYQVIFTITLPIIH